MIQLMARLHGIKPEEQPDYGQDVPGVVKGTAVFGLLSSGIVLAHVFGLLSTSLFVVLRTGTGWSVGQTLFITILSVLGIAALGFSGLLIWASRRGKLLMRDRVIAGLNLRGDEQVLDVVEGFIGSDIGYLSCYRRRLTGMRENAALFTIA